MKHKPVAIAMLVLALVGAVLWPFVEMNRTGGPTSIESALFFPAKYPSGDWSPADLDFIDVYFSAADNIRLHGWYCEAKDSKAVVLFAHGNAGHLATRVNFLRHLQTITGVSVLVFDYRGYGRSQGTPTIDGVLLDTRAARRKLGELAGVDDSEMILLGTSLGGALVVQLAAESAPRALILQSTFSSLRDLAEVHYPQYVSMVPESMLNSVDKIAKYDGPLFQSHGDQDKTIPLVLGKKLFSAATGRKVFFAVAGASHNDWMTDEYLGKLDEYIEGLVSTKGPT